MGEKSEKRENEGVWDRFLEIRPTSWWLCGRGVVVFWGVGVNNMWYIKIITMVSDVKGGRGDF